MVVVVVVGTVVVVVVVGKGSFVVDKVVVEEDTVVGKGSFVDKVGREEVVGGKEGAWEGGKVNVGVCNNGEDDQERTVVVVVALLG